MGDCHDCTFDDGVFSELSDKVDELQRSNVALSAKVDEQQKQINILSKDYTDRYMRVLMYNYVCDIREKIAKFSGKSVEEIDISEILKGGISEYRTIYNVFEKIWDECFDKLYSPQHVSDIFRRTLAKKPYKYATEEIQNFDINFLRKNLVNPVEIGWLNYLEKIIEKLTM